MKKDRIQIDKLRRKIRKHDYLYYVLNKPEISDREYDKLLKHLQELEKKYPQFISPDSPTQRVSGEVAKEFAEVTHSRAMLSLDNTYSSDEIAEWDERVKKVLRDTEYEYVVEPKIDGVSCSLVYKNGVLTTAATRGDGRKGEDITLNIRTIRSVPLSLLHFESSLPSLFEIRGEVYMTRADFQRLNQEMKLHDNEPFVNPRNASAGSLRQKNPKITAARRLNFSAHSCGSIEGRKRFNTHWEFLQLCRGYGIPAIENAKLCNDINKVIDYCMKRQDKRDTLKYEIDGMVIKVNSLMQQEKLGSTSRSPRWAMAYKFPAKQATTKINNIIVQVGRTGTITPVAVLQPVECGGVTISRATLHNFDEIKRLGVGIGDTVLIERAGEVIPKIVRVTDSKTPDRKVRFEIPGSCPECGGQIVKEKEEEVAYRCINPSCPAQLARGLIHFAKREAMDIEGLGESVVEQLVKNGIVKDFADVYSLKKKDLLKLDLFADRKAENLIKAIDASKTRPLSRLLYAFGIRHVGEKAAEVLAVRFERMDNLIKASAGEITDIDEIGPIMAESIVHFFHSQDLLGQKNILNLIGKLKSLGLNMRERVSKAAGAQALAGKSFVFTGEMSSLSRNEAKTKVKELGGNTLSSVTSKTDYVVAGENPGSKYSKAKTLGLKIITEEEFLKLLGKRGRF